MRLLENTFSRRAPALLNPPVEPWTQARYQQGGKSREELLLRQPQEIRVFESRPLRHFHLCSVQSSGDTSGVPGLSRHVGHKPRFAECLSLEFPVDSTPPGPTTTQTSLWPL